MLVSLSVSNFRSFGAEQLFSLVASKRLSGTHEAHLLPIPGTDEKVLRAGVVYGANGAGKSNLLKALQYAKQTALGARKDERVTGRIPFRFADKLDQPSTFDLQFIIHSKLYRFGFSVDDECITEEWLVEITGTKEKVIYERTTDRSARVTIHAPGLKNESERLTALVTVGGPHNQTFLATVRATLERPDFGTTLTEVIEWLDDRLTLITPDWRPASLSENLAANAQLREFSADFLRAASTGIDHLEISKRELSQDDLESAGVTPETLSRVLQHDDKGYFLALLKTMNLLVEPTQGGYRFYRVNVQAAHKHETKETNLDLAEESDGTRRILDLIPTLYQMKTGGAVCFIDEIDRSMHPLLVYKFIQFFLSACAHSPAQIIATTHETHLLDLNLLRRDEIWFAEKDPTGATHLYSLTDFNVRKDLRIENSYLQGRFGAIPFLGDIDRLIGPDP